MAKPKKGQLAQVFVTLVDSVDFASVESAVTESDFNSGATRKFYGINHGVSDAFTSGTVSKAGRLVRSGVFQLTLKGTENNYDQMQVRVSKTGCAEQILEWANVDYDDSDIMSRLSDVASDLRSYLVAMSDALSDAHSDLKSYLIALSDQISDNHSDVRSLLLGMSDTLSDTFALLSDFESNFGSRVPKEPAARSQLSDLHSDLRSYLVGLSDQLSDAHSDLGSKIAGITASVSSAAISDIASAVAAALGPQSSDIYSLLSDLNSNFLSRIPKEPAARSQLSDLHSDLKSYLAGMSDALSDLHSDFGSRVPKRVATDSQLSDLASDLRSYLVGLSGALSDVESQLDATDAAFVVRRNTVGSNVADGSTVELDAGAAATNDLYNGLHILLTGGTGAGQERLVVDYIQATKKAIVKPAWITNPASDTTFALCSGEPWLSDVHSDLRSYLAGMSDTLSDTFALLSDFESNLLSRIPKEPAARSQLSDHHSDLRSLLLGLSDQLSDLHSDFGSRVPKRVATDSQLSDLHSDLRSYLAGLSDSLSDAHSDLKSYLVGLSDQLSDAHSDLGSKIAGVTAAVSSAAISDIASAVAAALGPQSSDIYSLLSDLNSNFLSRIPKEPAARSQLSDLHSDLRSYLVGMSDSLSDAHSDLRSLLLGLSDQLSDAHSDLGSKIGGITVSIDSAAISDIASAVTAAVGAALGSDVASKVIVGLSDNFSNVQSNVNRTYSLLSDLNSNFLSRIPKEPAARSQLSDHHSDLRSLLLGMSDTLSDTFALLSDFESNLLSRIPKEPAARSQLSDHHSDLRSLLLGLSDQLSDLHSDFGSRVPKRVATDSQLSDLHSDLRSLLMGMSDTLSDTFALLSDFESNLTSRIPKEPAARSQLSDHHSDLRSLLLGLSDQLSDLHSDFGSRVPKRVATDSQLSDLHSDLRSYLAGLSDTLSDTFALVSDFESNLLSRIPKEPAARSQLSDLHSDLRSYLVGLSDQLSDAHSDLASKVGAVTVTLTASNISDIASALLGAIDPLDATVPGDYASGTAGYALGRIGSGQITTTSVVSQSGDASVVRGDDYLAVDSRALDWTDVSTSWPTLTSATITFRVFDDFSSGATAVFTKAGSVVTATGSNKKVRVELTSTNTASFDVGAYKLEVVATLSDASVVTLARGTLNVTDQ